MKDYLISALPAGETSSLNVFGADKIYCDSSDVANFEIKVDSNPYINFFEGRKYTNSTGIMRSITVKNNNAVPMTINLVIGAEDINDNITRLSGSINVTDIINAVNLSKPAIFKALAKVTIVNGGGAIKIMNSASTTREVIIQNNDTANGVWLSGSLVSAVSGKGTFIASGVTVILTTTANIYADNNSGANVDLNISYTAD